MADYTRADLKAALDRLPLEKGDVVFCHSNLGFFGRCEGIKTSDHLCETFFDAIMARIGTLVVPTFTYSFSRGKPFDIDQPAPEMGMFAEWVRKYRIAFRSFDPCYSVAAICERSSFGVDLIADVAENSFDGAASFFARFHRKGGKILNLNFDAGSTFVHWVERELGVPYRFDKTFTGTMRILGAEKRTRSTIFVRYLDDALEARFEAFDALARQYGMLETQRLGRGEIGVISAADTYALIYNTLPERPWFLTKAEALGITPDPAKFSALR